MMVSSNVGNSHACVRLSLDGGEMCTLCMLWILKLPRFISGDPFVVR